MAPPVMDRIGPRHHLPCTTTISACGLYASASRRCAFVCISLKSLGIAGERGFSAVLVPLRKKNYYHNLHAVLQKIRSLPAFNLLQISPSRNLTVLLQTDVRYEQQTLIELFAKLKFARNLYVISFFVLIGNLSKLHCSSVGFPKNIISCRQIDLKAQEAHFSTKAPAQTNK